MLISAVHQLQHFINLGRFKTVGDQIIDGNLSRAQSLQALLCISPCMCPDTDNGPLLPPVVSEWNSGYHRGEVMQLGSSLK